MLTVLVLSGCGSAHAGTSLRSDEADDGPTAVEDLLFPAGDKLAQNYQLLEAAIARCMAEAGFSYRPRDIVAPSIPPAPRLHTLSAAFASESGFGLAVGFRVGPGPNSVDPNDSLLDDLRRRSPAEADEWVAALRGSAGVEGCRTKAWNEVNGEWSGSITVLQGEFSDMIEDLAADPRIVDLESLWTDCMNELGYLDRGQGTFQSFVESFNNDVAELVEYVGQPDFVERHDRAVEREIVAARDAVLCADPLKEPYAAVWAEYELAFFGDATVPRLPVPG